jgi:nucleotide-binding universal stress UspA family protein
VENEKTGRNIEGGKTRYSRILVPLDGSERAERAIPIAVRLVRASGGSIILLRVVASPIEPAWQASESPSSMQESLDADRVEAAEYLARISAAPVLAGVATSTRVYKGMPAAGILTVARSQQVDIIIMCSHGYTAMTRWALGSVAEKVAFHAPTPVLVLREGGPVPAELSPDPATRPLRVLVALDGSERAEQGIEHAAKLIAALAAPAQGALHLTQVVEPAPADRMERNPGGGDESDTKLHKAREYLDTKANQLREVPTTPAMADRTLSVTWAVTIDADIAAALIRVAENGEDAQGVAMPGGCDIIAMTTHSYNGIARWTLGSITARVLKASMLPLLIVRPPDIMEKSNLTWDDATLLPM